MGGVMPRKGQHFALKQFSVMLRTAPPHRNWVTHAFTFVIWLPLLADVTVATSKQNALSPFVTLNSATANHFTIHALNTTIRRIRWTGGNCLTNCK